MSQNRADWLARSGRDFIQILRYFYGADLEVAGGEPAAFVQPQKGATMNQVQRLIALNPSPAPNLIRPPSGIEVLAFSGGLIANTPRTMVHTASPRTPLTVGIGADPLQTILSDTDKVIDAMNTQVTTYFGDNESVRTQWEQYRQAWRMFYYRNWFDTPLRESDAMQRAFAYKEGLNGWNNTVSARMAELGQGSTVYQGKVGESGGFPVLPALAIAAAVITAAAFAGART